MFLSIFPLPERTQPSGQSRYSPTRSSAYTAVHVGPFFISVFRSTTLASPEQEEEQQRQYAAQNRQENEPGLPCNKRGHIILLAWFPGTSAASPCSFSSPSVQEAPPLGSTGIQVARTLRMRKKTRLMISNTAESKAAKGAAITPRKSGTPRRASNGVLAVQHTGAASPAGNNASSLARRPLELS